MRRTILWMAAALAGCEGVPAPVATQAEPITAGQVTALNNVGRDTGIVYRLVDPPEPDLPTLEMWFNPMADLHRNSTYVDGNGAPLVTVTADPPGSAPISCTAFGTYATASLDIGGSDRTLNFAFGSTTAGLTVTGDPPGGADPPGGLNFSVHLVGSATLKVYRDGSTDPVCSTSATTAIVPGTGS